MAGFGGAARDRLRTKCVGAWQRVHASWAWRHKTKVVGTGISVGAYLQNNLSQVGKGLPVHVFTGLVGAAGVLVFVLGFVNMFLPSDERV